MNLFDIEMMHREVVDELIENGGAMSPELEARMAISRELFEAKGETYALIIKEMKGEIEQLEDLIASLQKKKKNREAAIETMSGRLLRAMQAFDIPKFKTLRVSMWVGSSKKLKVLDHNLIPKAYQKEVTEWKVLNAEIKAALDEGKEIPGVELMEGQHLQIR